MPCTSPQYSKTPITQNRGLRSQVRPQCKKGHQPSGQWPFHYLLAGLLPGHVQFGHQCLALCRDEYSVLTRAQVSQVQIGIQYTIIHRSSLC